MSPQQHSMAHHAYTQAYHTVSKTRQVVMLYDGTIRFIRQAKDAITENRIEDRFNLLVKASEVVLGLQSSLDFEQGGEVAQRLYDFYSSVDSRLLTIQRSNDIKLCDNVIEELKEMREAWANIDNEEQPAVASSADMSVREPAFSPEEPHVAQDIRISESEAESAVTAGNGIPLPNNITA